MEEPLPPGLAALVAGIPPRAAPPLDVAIPAVDIRPWLGGNLLPGVWSFTAARPGPHLVVMAVVHGNEIAGAAVLDRWLRAGLRPGRGRLSLVFANLDAYGRFDPADPTASRFVDEDMNRVWDLDALASQRRSSELRRARLLRPLLESADMLLDLHSMLWPSAPLVLAGQPERAHRLALRLGDPPLVVADDGHCAGRRLIDFAPFRDPAGTATALLVEAGEHWSSTTIATMERVAARLMHRLGIAAPGLPVPPPPGHPARLAQVTQTVTARTARFTFLRCYRGGEVVPERNTLIALDGTDEIRTPHDDCLLVMPALRTAPGHTAVRLARLVPAGG